MKNNTKVRLHLSKTLFENIVKEVLSEAKKMNMSGGAYTESVKMPKKAKKMEEVNAMADTDKMKKMEEVDAVRDTESMRRMHEMETDVAEGKMNSEWEKEIWKVLKAKFDLDPTTATVDFGPNGMSIKPVNYQVWADKFTKGNQIGYKGGNTGNINAKADKIAAYFNKKYGKNLVAEDEGALQPGDNITWLDGHQKENKGVVQSQEGGDYYKVKVTAAPIGGGAKVGDVITKQSGDVKKAMGEMQINVAEDGDTMNEFTGTETESSGAIAMLAAALGMGIPLAAALIKDLMRAKTPEEKKQVIQKELPGEDGGDVAPKEAFGPQNESKKKVMPKLNELRKQIKNK